ncbi:hypothetical protein JW921_03305, partial [Candidatus Fermentibacterales bacterium]|nr:hypothetical protein [Candidatus Fermentibacterales bacterium]
VYAGERPFLYAGKPEEYLLARQPQYGFYERAREHLTASDTLLLVDMGNRAFYAPGMPLYESWDIPFRVLEPLWAARPGSGCSLAEELARDGVCYMAIDMDMASNSISSQLDSFQMECWRDFLRERCEPVLVVGSFVLLRLGPPSGREDGSALLESRDYPLEKDLLVADVVEVQRYGRERVDVGPYDRRLGDALLLVLFVATGGNGPNDPRKELFLIETYGNRQPHGSLVPVLYVIDTLDYAFSSSCYHEFSSWQGT